MTIQYGVFSAAAKTRFAGLTPALSTAYDPIPGLLKQLNTNTDQTSTARNEAELAKKIRERIAAQGGSERKQKALLEEVFSKIEALENYTPTVGGPVEKILLEYNQYVR